MRIIGTDVPALMAAQFLEAHPNVGLDVLQHMTQMNRTVGIGQGAGNENLASRRHDQLNLGKRGSGSL